MEYLIDHGKKNVWCTPGMDKRAILALVRLTREDGVRNRFSAGWKEYSLPERDIDYHVFMVGHIPLSVLGITHKIFTNVWYELKDLMNDNIVLFNVYFGNGLEIPRDSCSLSVNMNGGILLAIKTDSSYQPIDEGTIYFRIYKNAFFASLRVDPDHEKIECETISNFDANGIRDFIKKHEEKNNRDYGKALACIKGIWYLDLNEKFIENDDIIDSVFDGSIRDIIPFKLKDLTPFISTADKMQKYLLHLPKMISNNNIIYYDDIEILVGHSTEYSLIKAVRLTLNEPINLRQLSHGDYSVSVDKIELIKRTFFDDMADEDFYLWVIVRHSGYERNLWFVNDRIRALYKLSDSGIVDAMLGVSSTVFFWKADYLESGYYAKLMGLSDKDIDLNSVADCYGYRGVVKALANTPIHIDAMIDNIIDLPANFHDNALVIEYNKDGSVSNFFHSRDSSTYGVFNPECPWLELIKGIANIETYIGYKESSFIIDPKINYRFFKTTNDDEGYPINDKWEDVTDTDDYSILNGVVTWSIPLDNLTTLAIGDNSIYWDSSYVDFDDHCLKYYLVVDVVSGDLIEFVDDYIHMGHYRIWLNNYALIRDMDFKIIDNIVYIVNKEFINDSLEHQDIVVVGDGINKNNWLEDRGYVEDGGVSFNKHYDYYDDRLLRCITNGMVYPVDVLYRPENESTEKIILEDNKPYIVENISSALKDDNINYDLLYVDCKQREELINDYLTLKLPEKTPSSSNDSSNYHLLYSPFLASVIYAFNHNELVIPDDRITDEILDDLIKNYKHLLPSDPATWGLNYNFIQVHPHPYRFDLFVTAEEYDLLTRLNSIYLKDIVILSAHLLIGNQPCPVH